MMTARWLCASGSHPITKNQAVVPVTFSCNFFPGKKSPKNLVKTYASTRSHQDGKIMQTGA